MKLENYEQNSKLSEHALSETIFQWCGAICWHVNWCLWPPKLGGHRLLLDKIGFDTVLILIGTLYSTQVNRSVQVRFSPPVNEPKNHWPCVLSLPGTRVVCWTPHPAGTRNYIEGGAKLQFSVSAHQRSLCKSKHFLSTLKIIKQNMWGEYVFN